jgi:hypothetical protein
MPCLGLVSSAFGLECVVLLLCGDWPGLRTDGPTIFGALPNICGCWLRCVLLSLGLLCLPTAEACFPMYTWTLCNTDVQQTSLGSITVACVCACFKNPGRIGLLSDRLGPSDAPLVEQV